MRVGAADAAVIAAQQLAAVAVELLDEQRGRDARQMLFHLVEGQASQFRHARACPPCRLARRPRPAPRGNRTARSVRRPQARFASACAPGDAVALELDGRVRGQRQRPGQGVVVLALDHGEFERGRDQHHPARRDAGGLLQLAGDGRGAEAAIALAGEEHGRGHAVGVDEIEPDELGKGLRVLLHAPEVGFLLLPSTARL